MSWYAHAIVSVLSTSAMLLCFRRLEKIYAIEVYLFYTWLATSATLAVIPENTEHIIEYKVSLYSVGLLLIAGIASWVGNYTYNASLRDQANLGYIEALSSVRILIAYAISLACLDASVEPSRLIASVGVIIGVVLVAVEGKRSGSAQETMSRWPIWALISGVMFGVLAICVRIAFQSGVPVKDGTAFFLFIASFLYGVTCIFRKKDLYINVNKKHFIPATLFSIIANYTLFASYQASPNLGYAVTISCSRTIILYIASLSLASDKFDKKKLLGILITFVSVIFLA